MATKLPATPGPGDLAAVLNDAAGSDIDFLVSRMALRTMMNHPALLLCNSRPNSVQFRQ